MFEKPLYSQDSPLSTSFSKSLFSDEQSLSFNHSMLFSGSFILGFSKSFSRSTFRAEQSPFLENYSHLSKMTQSFRIDQLITYPWLNIYLYLHHMCFIFGVLHQVLEIIFEVQKKRSKWKDNKKKMSFPTYKKHFFSCFLFLWTPFIFKPRNFFISYPF